MFARFHKSIVGTAVTAGVLGLAALFSAGTAQAGNVDAAFLAQLAEDGIIPPSDQVAIDYAQGACNALDDGHDPDEIVDALVEETGLSQKGASTFLVDAAQAYCPEYVA